MVNEIYMVRSETLLGFEDLVRDMGAEPESFYRRVGLTESLFENPNYMVPYASICNVLDIAARELGEENLGLELSKRLKGFQVGILWPLIAHSGNLRAALETGMSHFHLHNQGVTWGLHVEKDQAIITRQERISGDLPTFQWAILSVCSMFRVLKVLCGNAWTPSEVSFIHAPPADVQAYNRFFGVNVSFNRELTQIVFPAIDLERTIGDRSNSLYRLLNKQIAEMEARYASEEDFCSKIKLLIQQRIHSEYCTVYDISNLVSMHPKALQRKLRCYGTNFRELKAEVRLDMAERYLSDSNIPLTTIANILGYSALSNFSQAFKSRHLVSPTVWRNRAHDR